MAKPGKIDPPEKRGGKAASDVLAIAKARADRAYDYHRANIDEAYDDLKFRAGENQWDGQVQTQRQAAQRPCLVINRIPQFVRQVTGDIRQMRPAIKVVGVDDETDPKRAEIYGQLIRYVESRSDAMDAYYRAADSQVTCGIGHWRVETEYARNSKDIQEIRISPMRDGVSVLWDPDSMLPMMQDAAFCFVPVDMTFEVFKERYPKSNASNFDQLSAYNQTSSGWFANSADMVRLAEYWEKDGDKVARYLLTGSEVLEGPTEWAGSYIPIVPVVGEEVWIGDRYVRSGVVRYLKDPQRRYNYWASAQTEIIALQPKAPFIGTATNFADHVEEWERANNETRPYLTFSPDPMNSGQAPQRSQPPVSSSGFDAGLALAAEDMKAVTGIYDASLGNRSNETSGKAILARQREGDVGTFVFIANFTNAIKHTGRILVDLIPKIYDTARTLRVIGEDGKEDKVNIAEALGGTDAGVYDVTIEMGPSYSTKRAESRDSMMAFVQAVPQAAPVVADLYAMAQDWPLADKIASRLRFMLPPEIAAKEREEEGKEGEAQDGPAAPPQPTPEMMMQAQQAQMQQQMAAMAMQAEQQSKQFDVAAKQAQAAKAEADAMRAKIEMEKASLELDAMKAGQPHDPMEVGNGVGALAEVVTQMQQQMAMLADALASRGDERSPFNIPPMEPQPALGDVLPGPVPGI